MTVSLHKVIGKPMPANVFIARKSVYDDFKYRVNKLAIFHGKEDVTIYGSRDGFRAQVVYSRLKSISPKKIESWVNTGNQLAGYLAEKIRQELGVSHFYCASAGLSAFFSKSDSTNYLIVLIYSILFTVISWLPTSNIITST